MRILKTYLQCKFTAQSVTEVSFFLSDKLFQEVVQSSVGFIFFRLALVVC